MWHVKDVIHGGWTITHFAKSLVEEGYIAFASKIIGGKTESHGYNVAELWTTLAPSPIRRAPHGDHGLRWSVGDLCSSVTGKRK